MSRYMKRESACLSLAIAFLSFDKKYYLSLLKGHSICIYFLYLFFVFIYLYSGTVLRD